MALAIVPATAWVVRDLQGRVLVAFWGSDAPEEAKAWADRGYRVDRTEQPLI